jgi:hypothetical protein
MRSIVCILTITGRANGKLLAFGKRGTYNPASREKGSAVTTLHRELILPALRKPGIPKQDPKQMQSKWNAVAA